MFLIKVCSNKEWKHSVINNQDSCISKNKLTGVEELELICTQLGPGFGPTLQIVL